MCDRAALILLLFFLVSLVATGLISWKMPPVPKVSDAPSGVLSFQLAKRVATRQIWTEWREANVDGVSGIEWARRNLSWDRWLICGYTAAGILLALLVVRLSHFPFRISVFVAAGLVAIMLTAALADVRENHHCRRLLPEDKTVLEEAITAGAVEAKWRWARTKFAALLFLYPLSIVAVFVAALVRCLFYDS
jgi:hypothetical protein